MEQPLGNAIGNALEVTEAVEALRGNGPADLVQLSLQLGAQLLCLAGLASDEQAAHIMLKRVYTNGDAWEIFCRMVQAQGGDCTALHAPARLPVAPVVLPLEAEQSGYVAAIDARAFGLVLNDLGGGRVSKHDTINPAVGLVLVAKAGDFLAAGDTILFIHASSEADARRVMPVLRAAYTLSDTPALPPPLIADTITADV
jgi:pyrimidine-nucleoside phosphorylase